MKLKAAPIFNHVWVWMNARIPVSVLCFEWQKVHRTHSVILSDLLFSVVLMNEGKDSDLLLQIYRPYKAESGTLMTKQLQALLNSL